MAHVQSERPKESQLRKNKSSIGFWATPTCRIFGQSMRSERDFFIYLPRFCFLNYISEFEKKKLFNDKVNLKCSSWSSIHFLKHLCISNIWTLLEVSTNVVLAMSSWCRESLWIPNQELLLSWWTTLLEQHSLDLANCIFCFVYFWWTIVKLSETLEDKSFWQPNVHVQGWQLKPWTCTARTALTNGKFFDIPCVQRDQSICIAVF